MLLEKHCKKHKKERQVVIKNAKKLTKKGGKICGCTGEIHKTEKFDLLEDLKML